MGLEYYKKLMVDLRARLQKEKEAKKKDYESYAGYAIQRFIFCILIQLVQKHVKQNQKKILNNKFSRKSVIFMY